MARVLIIDDDGQIRTALAAALRQHGHDALVGRDGENGVQSLRREAIDVAVVDLFMPDMDGIETLKALKRAQPSLAVILMSGLQMNRVGSFHRMPDYLAMALEFGACRVLYKPFTPEDLMSAIASCAPERHEPNRAWPAQWSAQLT